MKQQKTLLTLSILSAIGLTIAHNAIANDYDKAIEKITVIAPQNNQVTPDALATGTTTKPDLASWLHSVPGANVNRNGPASGIAQFRGLYGDRVAAKVNGHTIIGAGPNAMDTPLSYTTPLIVESMSVYRGITPVSAAIDTLGGAIEVTMRKAQLSDDKLEIAGEIQSGYRLNGNAKSLATWTNIANKHHGIMVYGNQQRSDNQESGHGFDIPSTQFDKTQVGIDYRIQHQYGSTGASYHYTDTSNTGTASLPMDINYIYGNRVNLDGELLLDGWLVDWQWGALSAQHTMDNFSQRPNMNNAMYRSNLAKADSADFSVNISKNNITYGIDGYFADHNSTITNPNNKMFNINNFNNVEDERLSIFAEYADHLNTDTQYHVGIRLKQAKADANKVSHHMAMMNENIATLVSEFNAADRSITDNGFDVALSINHTLSDNTSLYLGAGIKQRAPSYQERYLWVPMEATGGLADGKTYVGNINLDSETAYQLDLGLTFQQQSLTITPHIYYQKIDDYIQGTQSTNMAVKMIANMMMNDNAPLVFSNTDARIYGADIRFNYPVDDAWFISGIASYVRGERTDIDDNLYRIAPANAAINLHYSADKWDATITGKLSAKQDKVSITNNETSTAGYGTLNLSLNYYWSSTFSARIGVDNLFDKHYANHLSGRNRVINNDIAFRAALPEEGMSAWAELNYQF